MARRRLVGHRDAGDRHRRKEVLVGLQIPVLPWEWGVKARKLGARLWRLQVSKRCGFDTVNKVFDLE